MTTAEVNKNFTKTIGDWNLALDKYTEEQFAVRPDSESWSIGQVCQHLMLSTGRVFLIIDKCLEGNQNETEQKSDIGEISFKQNALPDMKVKLPLTVQPTPEQPQNKQVVKNEFEKIQNNFNRLSEVVSKSSSRGKEKHPVLGFLNSAEWLQTLDMHFRHHIRQKGRIDSFLNSRVSK
jgi:hypothetical protein